ncbi:MULTISPECIES: ribose 5-phosphate isomerase B [unclassified Gilliamella]|uniref:ribose 5-phosphate isomerase B n=1 Tax=unclassified Gilliamella TaxID=2685620 RepID=UPI0022698246|nr:MULTISPECIES: ribose 5-phosphate isomerase B [unclassified Gilliamella]MCX8642239.1 ribose 5-phosphate isomerase B [Gilliamella sp. B3835]MCX8707637.1 ribose 5-phosphate isomerase B [Gilliamella sp. B3783]MCX8710036.1 ribose 5-phosphate isomerase B [Gilliamella sp. B3780]MCX8712833.1 ribose 5-phosphate isomerase B [Gilliamella sp. B3468]MCX8713504.1 ribose 5-phosphate isomerase B [Gilliamella sp. B3781]
MKSIAIGADDAAFEFRNSIVEYLTKQGIELVDYSSDKQSENGLYPDVANAVASAIKAGKHERGILICGTGIGVAIAANKVPGIRAAQCHDVYSAERARKSNNAQIMTMGARVIGVELAKKLVQAWLESEFEGGGSTAKVERICYYDELYSK